METAVFLSDKLRKRYIRFIMLALGGGLTGLTLALPEIGIIEWISLIPSALVLINICADERVRYRSLYGYGFFFFMCFYLVNFHWFINLYPLDFVDGMTKPAALAVVCAGWFGLSALQASVGGLVFVLFGAGVRCDKVRRFPIIGAFLAAALWAIFEWTQTLTWAGVPWGRLSIGQTNWLIGVQSASLLGCCFVTFLIVVVNFLAAYAILRTDKRKMLACIAAGIFLLNTAIGALIFFTYKDESVQMKVSAVQGNISSQEKWNAELKQKTLDTYEIYTKEAAAEGAQIVVWPESALPYHIDSNKTMTKYLMRVASENNVTILAGVLTSSEDGEDYNSVVAVLPDGTFHETVYSKRHLVPFGEFVPMRGLFEVLIPPLTELSMLEEDVAEGKGSNIMFLDEANIGAIICFDSIYDELSRASVLDGAELITLSTNDSWFLDSAALRMHAAQAKLRAIENGRYVVRAANTGISAIITPRGESLCELGANVTGQISADVSAQSGKTLYTYIGNIFVYMCIVLVSAWLIYEKIVAEYFICSIDKKAKK